MRLPRLLLTAVLALTLASARAAQVAGSAVVPGLAATFRALPVQARGPVADFLNSGTDIASFEHSLAGLDLAQPTPTLAAPAAQTASPAAERESLSSIEPFLRLAEAPPKPQDKVTVATRLTVAERVLAGRLPAEARAQLLEAVREVRRGLSDSQRESLVLAMNRIAVNLGRSRESDGPGGRAAPASSAYAPGAFASGQRLVPASWRLSAPEPAPILGGRMQPLSEVSRRDLPKVRDEIVEAAREMREEALMEGRGDIAPIDPDLIENLQRHELDSGNGISQIYRDGRGKVVGFALAYLDRSYGAPSVHLESIGVLREHRRGGAAREMMRAVAEKAKELKAPVIELVAARANSEAIRAFERMGFEDIAPERADRYSSYDALQLVAPVGRLLSRLTRTPAETAAPDGKNAAAVDVFAAAHPDSKAAGVFAEYGMDLGEEAIELLYHHVFAPAPGALRAPWFAGPALRDAVAELGAFIERAGQDSSAARFAELIGRAMARAGTHISEDPRTLKPYRWPAPNISGGEYWDLASGPNAAEWMLAGLDEKTHYRLFDNHPFVIGFLDEVAAIGREQGTLRADVSVESADVRHLKKPRRKLAAIRAKNVEVYVPGGTDAIEKMTDWIAEDGQLILQNNVDHRANDVRTIGPMIERLISKGWELRYLDPPSHDPRYNHISVYSLILTKPRADVPAADLLLRAAASRKVWDEFKSTSDRLSPADFMRRLIFG